jgi:pimeloyl-ACP methyl ester carboxylesterase
VRSVLTGGRSRRDTTPRAHAVALLKRNPQDIPQDIHDSDLIRHAPSGIPLWPTASLLEAKAPLLRGIKEPTLILVGEYDIADVAGQAGALEALIPGAQRVVVPDTGHLMYLEHADAFAALVAQFANGTLAQ